MESFVPCRVGADQFLHLFANENSTKSLCGRPVTGTSPQPGDREPCPECGKRLLKRIIQRVGANGVGSVEVIIHPAP